MHVLACDAHAARVEQVPFVRDKLQICIRTQPVGLATVLQEAAVCASVTASALQCCMYCSMQLCKLQGLLKGSSRALVCPFNSGSATCSVCSLVTAKYNHGWRCRYTATTDRGSSGGRWLFGRGSPWSALPTPSFSSSQGLSHGSSRQRRDQLQKRSIREPFLRSNNMRPKAQHVASFRQMQNNIKVVRVAM